MLSNNDAALLAILTLVTIIAAIVTYSFVTPLIPLITRGLQPLLT